MPLQFIIPKDLQLDTLKDKCPKYYLAEYKASNPKIDIYINGVYKVSTNHALNLRCALYNLVLKCTFSRFLSLKEGDIISLHYAGKERMICKKYS